MTARWLIGAHRDGAAIKVTDRERSMRGIACEWILLPQTVSFSSAA